MQGFSFRIPNTATTTIESWAETSRSSRASTFKATRRFCSPARARWRVESSQGRGTQASYDYSTRRFTIAGQAEHYDRGFRMDTAFINRVGVTRGWQYQALNFYPSHPTLQVDQTNQPVLVGLRRRRSQSEAERKSFICLPCDSTSRAAGYLRVDYGTGHETFAGQKFEIGRMMIDGGAQITRWLNIGGGTQAGPAIFYDPEAPYQGDRRSANLRIGLQPNARVNSNTSYSFVTFDEPRHRSQRLSRARR